MFLLAYLLLRDLIAAFVGGCGGSGWSNISMKVGRCVPVANRLALTWKEEDVVGRHPLFVVSIPLFGWERDKKI
jgi:hypothetical protein